MDNLDLLIEKFKEAKDVLQKAEEVEGLDKAYVSPTMMHGKVPKVVAPKPSTVVAEDQARASTGKPTAARTGPLRSPTGNLGAKFGTPVVKGEDMVKKDVSPDMKAHMLSDASRAAAATAAPKIDPKPFGVKDRGPVQAKKDLDWLTGTGQHAVHVPAGAGRDIPGFEKEEISFSKSGQWNLNWDTRPAADESWRGGPDDYTRRGNSDPYVPVGTPGRKYHPSDPVRPEGSGGHRGEPTPSKWPTEK